MKKALYSSFNEAQKEKAFKINKRVYNNFVFEKQRFFAETLRYKLENHYGFTITGTAQYYILVNPNVFGVRLYHTSYYKELSINERIKLERLVKNEKFSICYHNDEIEMEQAEAVAMEMFNDEKLALKLLEVIEQSILTMVAEVEDM